MRAGRVILLNTVLSLAVIAAAALVLSADRFWPFLLPDLVVPWGWPLFIAGTLLILGAVASFLSAVRATGAPGDAPTHLVSSGLFRYMRNPIYLGAGLELFGVAVFRQSPSFLLVALAFYPVMDVFVRRVEEPRLLARFGEAYREYKASVPRWFPARGRPREEE